MYIMDLPRNLLLDNIFISLDKLSRQEQHNDDEKSREEQHREEQDNQKDQKQEEKQEQKIPNKCSQETISNDSYDYYKTIKDTYFHTEMENILPMLNIDKTELCKKLYPYFNISNLFTEKDKEICYDQLEMHEIIKEVEFTKYFLFKSQLIICNFSTNSIFHKDNMKQIRSKEDIIESSVFSYDRLKYLFIDNSHKPVIDLFYLDMTTIDTNTNTDNRVNRYNNERNRLLVYFLQVLIIYQNKNGWLIMKVSNIEKDSFLQEFLYIITGWYSENNIMRPSIMSPFSTDMYVVCKDFNLTTNNKHIVLTQLCPLLAACEEIPCCYQWQKLLHHNISRIFKDKIKENRVVNAQIYLEFIEQLIAIFKNKNREDKLSWFQQNNWLKCESWYEKYIGAS